MKWVIDRFEEDYAVAECGNQYFELPKSVLPQGCAEGDVIDVRIDVQETKNRKDNADRLLDDLFGK